ncbi:MAG: hypothetical protein HY537_10820 [Deltaproteobacteria bacterium]|nr:hypothetical protein [Deltaproteobacteria bacterium]
MTGWRFFPLLVFTFSNAWGQPTRLATIPSCAEIVAMQSARSLEQVAVELHGGDPLHPTPQSRLGRYLAQTGAASRIHGFQIGSEFSQERLVIGVSPASFESYNELLVRGFPNLIEQVNPPNFLANTGWCSPTYPWHYWFRWLNQVYDYVGEPGFRSSEWRIPLNNIGPQMLLSDAEVSAWSEYLELTGDPKTNLRFPNLIPGFNYPTDAYANEGNCTAFFFHAPIGETRTNQVTSCGHLDEHGSGGGPEPRVGTLADYEVPAQYTDIAPLMKRVWNPLLRRRLMDVLGMPPEQGAHTSGASVGEFLVAHASPQRMPFVVYYTPDHTRLEFPTVPSFLWEQMSGYAHEISVGADGIPWVIGMDADGTNGNGVWKRMADQWARQDCGGRRVWADNSSSAWIVTDGGLLLRLEQGNNRYLSFSQNATDAASGGGELWMIDRTAVPGGFQIYQYVFDKPEYRNQGMVWKHIPGGAIRIAVAPDGAPWVVNDGGTLFRWNGTAWDVWHSGARDVAISSDGRVWIVSTTPYEGGYQLGSWNGMGWTAIPQGGTSVAPSPDGSIWVTKSDLTIWRGR